MSMNKQGKLNTKTGKVEGKNHIEWTKTVLPDGTERPGYTWNPVSGCEHGCRWEMPDGTIAVCYAEDVANGMARTAYLKGFEAHYWHPKRLTEPYSKKESVRIFAVSMGDLFGNWVPEYQIRTILDVCADNSQHTFQLLTKNFQRVVKLKDLLPPNVWVGASSAPDWYKGKRLNENQKYMFTRRIFKSLEIIREETGLVTWMSIEPLIMDMRPFIEGYPSALQWAVIGAASDSANNYYAPDRASFESTMSALDSKNIPVFFKGNMKCMKEALSDWREAFPSQ